MPPSAAVRSVSAPFARATTCTTAAAVHASRPPSALTRERSFLLSGLRELQREAGLAAGPELPDHVSEVLRLVAAPIPAAVRDDLVSEGLAPALGRMLAALERAGHPWADAVGAAAEALEVRADVPEVHGAEVMS